MLWSAFLFSPERCLCCGTCKRSIAFRVEVTITRVPPDLPVTCKSSKAFERRRNNGAAVQAAMNFSRNQLRVSLTVHPFASLTGLQEHWEPP